VGQHIEYGIRGDFRGHPIKIVCAHLLTGPGTLWAQIVIPSLRLKWWRLESLHQCQSFTLKLKVVGSGYLEDIWRRPWGRKVVRNVTLQVTLMAGNRAASIIQNPTQIFEKKRHFHFFGAVVHLTFTYLYTHLNFDERRRRQTTPNACALDLITLIREEGGSIRSY
jgi:hypothetical protein